MTSHDQSFPALSGEQVQAHTRGPWLVKEDEVYSVPRYQSVCTVLGVVGESEANARLIAAAPDLLDALRPFANYACDVPCECHNCRARAAIARATS
jgi:hypothetical protein